VGGVKLFEKAKYIFHGSGLSTEPSGTHHSHVIDSYASAAFTLSPSTWASLRYAFACEMRTVVYGFIFHIGESTNVKRAFFVCLPIIDDGP
jgi:hypothetical protein